MPTKSATDDSSVCDIKNCERGRIRARVDTPAEVRCLCPRHATTAKGTAKRNGEELAAVVARMVEGFDAANPSASGKALAGKGPAPAGRRGKPAKAKRPARKHLASAHAPPPPEPQPRADFDLSDPVLASIAPLVRCARVVERLGGVERAERLADALAVSP